VDSPKLDLCNRELFSSHLNALVASEMGLPADDVAAPSRRSCVWSLMTTMKWLPPEVRSALDIQPSMFND
jgi:hypothetical protein